ncbi:MAG: hypothetical protein HEP71_31885 [Roseivirga sp.]|nr:hypothetical protein [Roseivirga sp.]
MELLNRITALLLLGLGLWACDGKTEIPQATTYDFPTPVDTGNKPIEVQEKQLYDLGGGVYLTNDFPAARLNAISRVNDTLLAANIVSENYPINNSPWYAFKAWASDDQEVYIKLNYTRAKHRYPPKLSADGKTWREIDAERVTVEEDGANATIKLSLSSDTLWVAAQEIYDTKRVWTWAEDYANHPYVSLSSIGKSGAGRDLLFLDINNGQSGDKDVIVILSRQHPPEVTGFFAMQAFVERMMESAQLEAFLKKYRVVIYPLLNPDGVDMGHWRHNSNGVDLNRDWAYYRQPETRAVADHIVRMQHESGGNVLLGLDFHSTYNDVFYTQDKAIQQTPTTPWFREQWFQALEDRLPGYKVNEKPKGLATPVTKGWFYAQFGAEGMTYEIGDRTPRDTIDLIGKITSEEMIRILLENR